MTTVALVRGANTTIDDPAVQVAIAWRAGSPVDPCALLVTAQDKVRGDDDFVFYNQPRDTSGAVELTVREDGGASLAVRLGRLPAAVDKVVIAGSMDTGTFDAVPGLELTVNGRHGRILARFPVTGVERVDAMIFGELYRRDGQWKFRAVGQGFDSGLAGLVTHYGVTVDDDAPAQPPAPRQPRPDWHPLPDDPATLRWWTGTEWSMQTVPRCQETPTTCGRCGGAKSGAPAGGRPSCARCDTEIAGLLSSWRTKAAKVLEASGPQGPEWDALWQELRYHRIDSPRGREALRPAALQHLQQVVAFAFADDLIERHEIEGFDDAVRRIGVTDPAITDMRRRLQRGYDLGLISAGDVPRIAGTTLPLDAGEILHLDTPATRIRFYANGPRPQDGRLIVTNTKLRFVSDTGGSQIKWKNVMEIRPENGRVVLATTSAEGGNYKVDDAEHVAAVLTGVLRVAKRIAQVPAQRDSRSIPAAMKAEVWRLDGGACRECKATEYLEFDHVIPWSRGGATSVGNLQLLCRRCNLAKGARI
ncbi:TerD family protein [Dactylosporangium aurantiacum]|uniref:TerD family protein n=1 Tax=Dactylosporangium aurantiacum TaxID=35754 RepID=A0A9Q9MH92_9ACTN|nr:TerD family protein [Dactylosporangium aurantiacum]MDG6101786.1 TerD family protein [Dactylosporangium aurantiacum]UWZ52406.1 TerD family protein [Dactylosporangium aurantiacum]